MNRRQYNDAVTSSSYIHELLINSDGTFTELFSIMKAGEYTKFRNLIRNLAKYYYLNVNIKYFIVENFT